MAALKNRFQNAWSAFMGRDPTNNASIPYYSGISGMRPDKNRMRIQNERSLIMSVYNQIALDCASKNINHVKVDEDGRYESTINDSLNRVLSKDANIDQTGRGLIKDTIISMFDEGYVALVPVYTNGDPNLSDSYEILSARVGKIVQWYPYHVKVDCYDERIMRHREIMLEKRYTPIIENPFYDSMNRPNSTNQRLIRVLNQLDCINEDVSVGKLDLIIQLPYSLRNDMKVQQAEERKKMIEAQLNAGSKRGIAYIDPTEKVIQLNRPLENDLWTQYKDLKEELFNQLGFNKAIFDGTADEKTMLNYTNRTLEPILTTITEEIERKWLSRTALSQGQAIRYFIDPFKLVPVNQIAEIADKFTRNEIATSNEIRSGIGMRPSKDPKADMLVNSNINQSDKIIEEKEDVKIQNE